MADIPAPLPVTDAVISRIAREVARDIYPIETIREQNKLTMDQWEELLQTPIFAQRLSEELTIWNASDPMSIAQRIRAKAATMVEDCLLEAYALIHDKTQPMPAKIEALKWASRMAGIDANPNVNGSNNSDDRGVKITINIGDQKIQFDKEKSLPSKVIDAAVVDLTPQTTNG